VIVRVWTMYHAVVLDDVCVRGWTMYHAVLVTGWCVIVASITKGSTLLTLHNRGAM
jgi:hypothetical protein